MQAATRVLLRRAPAAAAACYTATTPLARAVSADAYPNSFNPEAYMRFPQFLHDINQKLLMYKNSQDTQGLLEKGRLVYSNKCVTVEVLVFSDVFIRFLNINHALSSCRALIRK